MKENEEFGFSDDPEEIVKDYKEKEHNKWFNQVDPEFEKTMGKENIEYALRYVVDQLSGMYKLKRVIIQDKGEIVGFLIWTPSSERSVDRLDGVDGYPVLLSVAVHPDYRNRGLLKKMIEKSGLQRPYLVHTSNISPKEMWEKMGCKVVRKIDSATGNEVRKCD